MEKQEWQHIHTEILEFARLVAKKHGLTVKAAKSKYSEHGMTTTFTYLANDPESLAARAMEAAADWRLLCQAHDLKEEWLGQTFKEADGTEYKIVGCNLKARRNSVLLERVRDHKSFCCTPDWAKERFNAGQ